MNSLIKRLMALETSTLLHSAFGIVVIMIVALTGIRSHQLELTARQIETVVNNHMVKIKYAGIMRNSARERTLGLHRMILTGDAFNRDEQWLKFNHFGGEFARARLKILSMPLSQAEADMMALQGKLTSEALIFQNRVIELIEQGQMETARKVLESSAIVAQDKVLMQLTAFYEHQEQAADLTRDRLRRGYDESQFILIMMAISFIVLSIMILLAVSRVINNKEQALRQSVDQLKGLNQAHSHLLGNVGLEFEGHLLKIQEDIEQSTDVAREYNQHNKHVQEPLTHAVNKIQYLSNVSELGTELARIETGYLDLFSDDVEVCPLVNEVVNEIQPLTARNNNTVSVQCSGRIGTIKTDRERLRGVLVSLLKNACTYTEYGMVSINVSREKTWVVFRIEDTGVGISKEKLKSLFDVFHEDQVQSNTHQPGYALNLALRRRLCQLMGGDLLVESEENIGTTCRVLLPY